VISEPELTGGPEEPVPDVISDADREPRPAATGSGGRRPWIWGVGGLAVASAAWAVGLHASGLHHDSAPDLHGYALDGSPCAGATLKPLDDALKATQSQTVSPSVVHLGPALDQIRCTLSATSPNPGGGMVSYEAFVTVDLHKKTDPRPEFDDQHSLDSADLAPVEDTKAVPGLGDEAYLLTVSDETQELKVLHGGAVFTLTLTGYGNAPLASRNTPSAAGLSTADPTAFQPALTRAMRNVMREQHQRP
jgi:hypothetical protein